VCAAHHHEEEGEEVTLEHLHIAPPIGIEPATATKKKEEVIRKHLPTVPPIRIETTRATAGLLQDSLRCQPGASHLWSANPNCSPRCPGGGMLNHPVRPRWGHHAATEQHEALAVSVQARRASREQPEPLADQLAWTAAEEPLIPIVTKTRICHQHNDQLDCELLIKVAMERMNWNGPTAI